VDDGLVAGARNQQLAAPADRQRQQDLQGQGRSAGEKARVAGAKCAGCQIHRLSCGAGRVIDVIGIGQLGHIDRGQVLRHALRPGQTAQVTWHVPAFAAGPGMRQQSVEQRGQKLVIRFWRSRVHDVPLVKKAGFKAGL